MFTLRILADPKFWSHPYCHPFIDLTPDTRFPAYILPLLAALLFLVSKLTGYPGPLAADPGYVVPHETPERPPTLGRDNVFSRLISSALPPNHSKKPFAIAAHVCFVLYEFALPSAPWRRGATFSWLCVAEILLLCLSDLPGWPPAVVDFVARALDLDPRPRGERFAWLRLGVAGAWAGLSFAQMSATLAPYTGPLAVGLVVGWPLGSARVAWVEQWGAFFVGLLYVGWRGQYLMRFMGVEGGPKDWGALGRGMGLWAVVIVGPLVLIAVRNPQAGLRTNWNHAVDQVSRLGASLVPVMTFQFVAGFLTSCVGWNWMVHGLRPRPPGINWTGVLAYQGVWAIMKLIQYQFGTRRTYWWASTVWRTEILLCADAVGMVCCLQAGLYLWLAITI